MAKQVSKDVQLVGELFLELFSKYSKVESKKHIYKNVENLTLIEINTIMTIGYDTMKTMSQIANQLGVTFGTPTITIDRLIKKGLVQRIRSEEDRRQVFIKLSLKGQKTYETIDGIKNEVIEKIFGVLTEKEREGLISTLSKLNGKLDEVFLSI